MKECRAGAIAKLRVRRSRDRTNKRCASPPAGDEGLYGINIWFTYQVKVTRVYPRNPELKHHVNWTRSTESGFEWSREFGEDRKLLDYRLTTIPIFLSLTDKAARPPCISEMQRRSLNKLRASTLVMLLAMMTASRRPLEQSAPNSGKSWKSTSPRA